MALLSMIFFFFEGIFSKENCTTLSSHRMVLVAQLFSVSLKRKTSKKCMYILPSYLVIIITFGSIFP